jgi:hypothetical protein
MAVETAKEEGGVGGMVVANAHAIAGLAAWVINQEPI